VRPPAPLLLLTALVFAVGCGGDDDSGPEGGAVTLKAGSVLEVSAKEYFNSEYSPNIAAGMWQVLGAMTQRPRDLSELAARLGSDKWGGRWYTPHYQKHFEP